MGVLRGPVPQLHTRLQLCPRRTPGNGARQVAHRRVQHTVEDGWGRVWWDYRGDIWGEVCGEWYRGGAGTIFFPGWGGVGDGTRPRAPGGPRHGVGNRALTSQLRTGQSTSYGDVKSSYGGAGGWDMRGCATGAPRSANRQGEEQHRHTERGSHTRRDKGEHSRQGGGAH